MRGHWVSGTRKLNRHYQSSEGGDYTLIDGLPYALIGIQFVGEDERYNQEGTFYNDDSRNIVVPPCFQTANIERDLSTPISIDDVHLQYGEWRNYGDNIGVDPSTLRGKRRESGTETDIDTKIWRYGKFKGVPQWIKSVPINTDDYEWAWPPANKGNMWWGVRTLESYNVEDDYDIVNQNRVHAPLRDHIFNDMYDTAYIDDDDTHMSYEASYAGKTINIIVPVYEIIAMPYIEAMDHTELHIYQAAIGTSGVVKSKIRIKNLPRGYKLVCHAIDSPPPLPANASIYEFNTGNVYKHNGYINMVHMYYGYYMGASEIGRFNYLYEFMTDELYYPLFGRNADDSTFPIIAGTIETEDRGTVNMIYAMRLDHLEIETINPTDYISSYRFKLGNYGVLWEGI